MMANYSRWQSTVSIERHADELVLATHRTLQPYLSTTTPFTFRGPRIDQLIDFIVIASRLTSITLRPRQKDPEASSLCQQWLYSMAISLKIFHSTRHLSSRASSLQAAFTQSANSPVDHRHKPCGWQPPFSNCRTLWPCQPEILLHLPSLLSADIATLPHTQPPHIKLEDLIKAQTSSSSFLHL